jgi:hypothetical protein
LTDLSAAAIHPVGSGFIRANGRLYDAFFGSFLRNGSDRTHNIGTPIDVETFAVFDEEGDYYQDKNGLYFFERYPTTNACITPGNGLNDRLHSSPLYLQKIELSSPEERALYRGQKHNIFLGDQFTDFTPYAKLGRRLFWRHYGVGNGPKSNGQFTEVSGADPEKFNRLLKKDLGGDSGGENLYTDGQHVILAGKIVDIRPQTVKPVTYVRKGVGKTLWSCYLKADGQVFYFPTCAPAGSLDEPSLVETDADPETFEVVDTNGSWSGLVARDKSHTFTFDSAKRVMIEQPR